MLRAQASRGSHDEAFALVFEWPIHCAKIRGSTGVRQELWEGGGGGHYGGWAHNKVRWGAGSARLRTRNRSASARRARRIRQGRAPQPVLIKEKRTEVDGLALWPLPAFPPPPRRRTGPPSTKSAGAPHSRERQGCRLATVRRRFRIGHLGSRSVAAVCSPWTACWACIR